MQKTDLISLWEKENTAYRTKEVGSGVQAFVKKVLRCPELFDLQEGHLTTPDTDRRSEFLEETNKKHKRADVVIYVDEQIVIPMEIERFGNIEAGEQQLFDYQLLWDKKTGILTDGYKWRFYIGKVVLSTFTLDQIFTQTELFLTFWREYIQPINYYRNFFQTVDQTPADLNIEENRQRFFTDTKTLIESFKLKLALKGYFAEVTTNKL